jgi:hypothetical protein
MFYEFPEVGFSNPVWTRVQFTLMLQKSRVPRIQGVKGEAVLDYREPLTIPQYCGTGTGDAVPSAFPEGKQQGEFFIDPGSHLLWNLEKPVRIAQLQVIHSLCHSFALLLMQC